MSDTNELLFEIGTEELPPQSLLKLSEALQSNIVTGLKAAELSFERTALFATPRRIAVSVNGLQSQQQDRVIERKGPSINAALDESGLPSKAAVGFAKSCGVKFEELARTKTEKGEWLSYSSTIKGKKTTDIIPEIIQKSVNSLPIAKKMRWGAGSVEFVRPVHWVLLLFAGQIVECEILGIKTGNLTYGHRFHAPCKFEIQDSLDYQETLENDGYVIPGFNKRKQLIKGLVEQQAQKFNGTAVIDEALLNEVTALNEWPVAIVGGFDSRYLKLPGEVLITTMQVNQKYFPVKANNEKLLPNFITISNIQSSNPQAVINGNERVVKPRLADAEFFWDQDRKTLLIDKSRKLAEIVFQNKLGTVAEKSQRVQALASMICKALSQSSDDINQAAMIAKADLVSEMVGEFPSLQGVMGKYYALSEGEKDTVALAIEEQYFPKHSGGRLPSQIEGQILSLAEKIDTLTGIFSVGLIPTGDRDPYGLRRASIGILRIIIECDLDLNLNQLIEHSLKQFKHQYDFDSTYIQVIDYINERLKGICLDLGYSVDEFESVRSLKLGQPVDFMIRMKAVKTFKQLPQGEDLASANKRIRNILKKSKINTSQDYSLLTVVEEKQLLNAATNTLKVIEPLLQNREYTSALTELAELGPEVNAFFDNVMVMVEDDLLRASRLGLLQMISDQFLQIADVSKLQH